jgi:predicted transcriptional regulator of viral defense system
MVLRDIVTSEFDYNILLNALREYRFPRNKIRNLLLSGDIVRVKKGLYVKSDAPYSLPVLANMVYGPSYVSQHYALALYGLIPERVHVITSVTLGRRKRFDTPLGVFTYDPLPERLFSLGVRRVELSPTQPYQIASPEKAILDIIWKRSDLETTESLEYYLVHDLRLDLDHRELFSMGRMRMLERAYKKRTVTTLTKILMGRANHE